jgi:hypothetical protein
MAATVGKDLPKTLKEAKKAITNLKITLSSLWKESDSLLGSPSGFNT